MATPTLKYLTISGQWAGEPTVSGTGFSNDGESPVAADYITVSVFSEVRAGLTFTAIYSDGSKKVVTPTLSSFTFKDYNAGVAVPFSYTENGVTVTAKKYLCTCGPLLMNSFGGSANPAAQNLEHLRR